MSVHYYYSQLIKQISLRVTFFYLAVKVIDKGVVEIRFVQAGPNYFEEDYSVVVSLLATLVS